MCVMNILDALPLQKDLKQLWTCLPNARLVGGIVRDLLSHQPVTDIDMATPDPPERIMELLKKNQIKTIPTGLSHGTLTALIGQNSFEITTLRKDISTDGRHAVVQWTSDWQEDAARRDFTINAMFCDRKGKIWDYFNGRQDLKEGSVKFVGNAAQRIKEDALRILRFFRFYARFGHGKPNEEAIEAISALAGLLTGLSAERRWSEWQKIIIGPQANKIISLMDETGVLPVLLPFRYNVARFDKFVRLGAPQDPILRLAALLEDKDIKVASHFKFSTRQRKQLKGLFKPIILPTDADANDFARLKAQYSSKELLDQSWLNQLEDFVLNGERWDHWRSTLNSSDKCVFPLKGRDLVERGIEPGPQVGKLLNSIYQWWLKGGCKADKEQCLYWFKKNWFDKNLRGK